MEHHAVMAQTLAQPRILILRALMQRLTMHVVATDQELWTEMAISRSFSTLHTVLYHTPHTRRHLRPSPDPYVEIGAVKDAQKETCKGLTTKHLKRLCEDV